MNCNGDPCQCGRRNLDKDKVIIRLSREEYKAIHDLITDGHADNTLLAEVKRKLYWVNEDPDLKILRESLNKADDKVKMSSFSTDFVKKLGDRLACLIEREKGYNEEFESTVDKVMKQRDEADLKLAEIRHVLEK